MNNLNRSGWPLGKTINRFYHRSRYLSIRSTHRLIKDQTSKQKILCKSDPRELPQYHIHYYYEWMNERTNIYLHIFAYYIMCLDDVYAAVIGTNKHVFRLVSLWNSRSLFLVYTKICFFFASHFKCAHAWTHNNH